MYVDALLLLSDAQAVTTSAASEDYLDVGAVRNLGVGEPIYVVVSVDTAMADSGSDATVDVDLYGDSTTSFTPDGSQRLFRIPAASAAGSVFYAQIAPDFASNYRYLELYYTVNNGPLTAGAFTAFITHDIAKFVAYAKNYNIS